MPNSESNEFDWKAPPFDHFKTIRRLGTDRSGHNSVDHVRHHLFIARDKRTQANVLIKLTAKPGLVYQHDLTNEIATLTTINRELPDSRYFPGLLEHGTLRDGRVFLVIYLFDEFPLATAIGPDRVPAKTVEYLRTAIEVARALVQLHRLEIFHADLNPMNILRRIEKGGPVIRIVDFESSYERNRHAGGAFYSPATTPNYTAPEVAHQPPDARSDLYSLGAVLYTMLAGYQWTWTGDAATCVKADAELDRELKSLLLEAVDADPARRLASVQAFHDGLGAYLERIWPGRSW